MIKLDEDLFICDLAETYHIYNYKEYPPTYIGILAKGLRDDSRIKMKLTESKLTYEQAVLASILDGVNLSVWMQTKDARSGANRPKSLLKALTEDEEAELQGYDSGEEFDKAFKQKLGE